MPGVAQLLSEFSDVVEQRVVAPQVPAWCAARGWETFLLGLSPDALSRCEAEGLLACAEALGAPESLCRLAARVVGISEAFAPVAATPRVAAGEGASARKRSQVAALAELCAARAGAGFAPIRRVVDVGAGRGHLTRELARTLELPAVGLDCDGRVVELARQLTREEQTEFKTLAATPDALRFEPGDLVVGLHACGSLGDTLAVAAARDRVDLVLVCCCLQKTEGPRREPLSAAGKALGLGLRRELLGLTNLGRQRRVPGTTPEVMRTRTTRYALLLLLRARGLELGLGDEMRGLQLRKARRGLASLAQVALAKRGLAPASEAELASAEARARVEFGRIRRLSLARSMLGRVLELAVVLDRASVLEEAGHQSTARALFDRQLSPRNLGVVAWRTARS